MTFDEAVALLRARAGRAVVIHMAPEGTVMRGRLSELDSSGLDAALFGVDTRQLTGVALALFRDGFESAELRDDGLVIRQGRVTLIVTCET